MIGTATACQLRQAVAAPARAKQCTFNETDNCALLYLHQNPTTIPPGGMHAVTCPVDSIRFSIQCERATTHSDQRTHLPLASHRLSVQCPVDYSRDINFIYIHLATAAMKCGLSLIILDQALAFGGLAQQKSNWPSWVPG
jgi:hypothetical protein